MSREARARLEAAQEALLAHLLEGAPAPPGFDAARLLAEAQMLARRRAAQRGQRR